MCRKYVVAIYSPLLQASIISFRGYPVRTYSVTTDDGYILELHRIPFGKSSSGDSSIRRRVVFLQHGLLNTDAAWLMLPSDQALGILSHRKVILVCLYVPRVTRVMASFSQLSFWPIWAMMCGLETHAGIRIHANTPLRIHPN